jgi:hypothetical protein
VNALAAGGSNRELAKHLLDVPQGTWRIADTLKQFGGQDVQATREALANALVPLATQEPKLDGPETRLIVDRLKMIGAKMRPDWPADIARTWCMALLAALSDLPSHILTKAAQEALHVPFKFPTDVEEKVREIGNAKLEAQRRAIRRLDAMQAELIRARTQLQIEDKDRRHVEPITTTEVHALARSPVGKELIRMGLAAGFITSDQLPNPEDPDTLKEE